MTKTLVAVFLLFFLRQALAEEAGPPPDDNEPEVSSEMKASGGFVNMEPETDYEAPDAREPASDDSGDPNG